MNADDTGRNPVAGTLVGADATEVVIHCIDDHLGDLHLHLPRAGFGLVRA